MAPRQLGFVAHGIDVAADAAGSFKEIKGLLDAHGVVVLPNQCLTRAEMHLFAQHFGDIGLHLGQAPNESPDFPGMLTLSDGVDSSGEKTDGASKFGPKWHSDFAPCVHPGFATLLYCREAPTNGGATLFADMQQAFVALPPGERERCAEMKVRISYIDRLEILDADAAYGNNLLKIHEAEAVKEMVRRRRPDIEHPMVRRLPDITTPGGGCMTCLWLGDAESSVATGGGLRISQDYEEGRAFLHRIQEYATGPQFRYRHVYQPNDLVIWDNRQVMHRGEYETVRASSDGRRVMWHVGTKGERPLAHLSTLSLLTPPEPDGDCWRSAMSVAGEVDGRGARL